MNKISKKIVSLVTMAAFALTLVPAAAFADASKAEAGTTVTVTDVDYNTAKVDIKVGQADFKDLQDTATQNSNIVVWATGVNGVVSKTDVSYTLSDGTDATMWTPTGETGNDFAVLSAPATVDDLVTVNATFAKPGTYTLHAAINTMLATNLAGMQAQEIGNGDTFTRDNYADPHYSGYGVVENGAVVANDAVDVDEVLETSFVVNHAYKQGTTSPLTENPNYDVKIWAVEKGQTAESRYATFDKTNVGSMTITKDVFNNDPVVDVTFDKSGTYILRAAVVDASGDVVEPLQYATEVTVNDKVYTIDRLEVEATTSNKVTPVEIEFDSNNMGKLDLTELDPNFDYDGIDDVILNGVAYDEDNHKVQGKEIVATTNKDSVIEFDGNKETKTTTNFGEFTISFDMQDKSNGTVYLTNEEDGIEYSIQVIAAKTSAANIDRTKSGGYVLAGNDKTYGEDTYAGETVKFTDAVQFAVTDQKEQPVTGNIEDCKIEIRDKANDSKLVNHSTDNDDPANKLKFVWDDVNGVYTLAYTASGDSYITDLTEGKYEVRVALPNGDNATVTFNVAKFGTVQDTVLDVQASDHDFLNPANPNNYSIDVDDQITLGQFVNVDAYYVDGNGIKVPADVTFGFNGEAVRDFNTANGTFWTPEDTNANESLIGTEVTIYAYNTAKHQLVDKTLTVVKSYTDKTLEFGSEQGPIAKDNKVPVSVVNEDGKVQQVKGTITAWVADQSNEDAKVSVDTTNATVNSGKGSITVYSDEETTADIVVIVKAGTEVYPATLHYTFGAEDPLANRTVVMTIDSTEYVVNNNVFTGDAAPYIDDAWRTMVPIRALMEAFDSEVIWNQDDETVTINFDGDTQIVMTVGETGYTIDGVDGEMDTVPVNTGDRVYVPIRFVAEGIGFHVTPLYNADGLTASVVFQK